MDLFPDVNSLSGDSSSNESLGYGEVPGPAGSKKRKREPVDRSSVDFLRAKLGRRCLCRGWNCFEKFARQEDFAEFQAWAKEWNDLHKLDQDRVATCAHLFAA